MNRLPKSTETATTENGKLAFCLGKLPRWGKSAEYSNRASVKRNNGRIGSRINGFSGFGILEIPNFNGRAAHDYPQKKPQQEKGRIMAALAEAYRADFQSRLRSTVCQTVSHEPAKQMPEAGQRVRTSNDFPNGAK